VQGSLMLGLWAFAFAAAGQMSLADGSVLGLVLGQHTLEDAVALLGPAARTHTGDAGESETSVCYRTSRGEVITFASTTEMAGGSLELTSVRLSSAVPPEGECGTLTRAPVHLANGIGLGMTRAKIEGLLGVGLRGGPGYLEQSTCTRVPFEKGTAEYDRWAKAPGCFADGESPHYRVCVSVAVRLKKGRAVWIEIARSETVC